MTLSPPHRPCASQQTDNVYIHVIINELRQRTVQVIVRRCQV